ncbi:MAG: hypothetical protein A3I39_00075 [Candidatus Yanofskybacteria bacterium RIFCSPLOWO2_02_FULL_47_9b]|uniref:Uncharacterized protein n=1 Tax=Candidatus Yanofskybacteria bacterium RIFCSPLOWO2_02_FULL_47_9b TaxID=1802708 RepID=A0A1F8HC75_9BACT|nr:MAG: hypothetical protein A3I39_00075 [Candidatus Yanofskybacteria bacterium RIFCSPLOWO2_02_FULL_47_9b]
MGEIIEGKFGEKRESELPQRVGRVLDRIWKLSLQFAEHDLEGFHEQQSRITDELRKLSNERLLEIVENATPQELDTNADYFLALHKELVSMRFPEIKWEAPKDD